jgi:hypothetical protein
LLDYTKEVERFSQVLADPPGAGGIGQTGTTLSGTAAAEGLLAQQGELVAHARGLLELEVAGVLEHLLFQLLDALGEVLLAQRLHRRGVARGLQVVAAALRSESTPSIRSRTCLVHAARRDAVRRVVGESACARRRSVSSMARAHASR